MAEVTLGRQRSPQHERGSFMTRYLRAANVKDGVLDLGDIKDMNFTPREREIFSLRPGDVLVSEGAGSLAALGAAAVWNGELPGPVCFQNTLLRLRPRSGMNSRFLAWWCRYAYSSGLFASVATGANIYHLSAERVRALPAWVPDEGKQRAIADFLDAETTRIDALIEKKRRMIALLRERQQALVDESVRSFSTQPLKHAAAIVVSNVDKVTTEGQEPVRLCNYTDVYYQRHITDDLDFMAGTATREQVARFGLKAGYVLITSPS